MSKTILGSAKIVAMNASSTLMLFVGIFPLKINLHDVNAHSVLSQVRNELFLHRFTHKSAEVIFHGLGISVYPLSLIHI